MSTHQQDIVGEWLFYLLCAVFWLRALRSAYRWGRLHYWRNIPSSKDPRSSQNGDRRLRAHLELAIWRINRLFGARPALLPTPPDPALTFPHPANKELLDYLKQRAELPNTETNAIYIIGGYSARCHPDLVEYLYAAAFEGQVTKAAAYGRPVLATTEGLIFAWAGGTGDFFVRLGLKDRERAGREGGRFDPTYGEDWINFPLVRLMRTNEDWRATLQKWLAVSYRDSIDGRRDL